MQFRYTNKMAFDSKIVHKRSMRSQHYVKCAFDPGKRKYTKKDDVLYKVKDGERYSSGFEMGSSKACYPGRKDRHPLTTKNFRI